MQLLSTPPEDDLATAIRQFVINQGDGRTDETRQRYVQVADDLMAFLGGVDIAPWMGPQLAAHLELERARLGQEALLTSFGLTSFIRVLPGFVEAPWLPPPGAQRRTHRAAVRYLLTFLRLRATQEGCLRKDDLKAVDKALGHSFAADYREPVARRTGTVSCTVTLDLVEHLVDRLLERVADGEHETLDEAIAARINPVQVTMWREPELERDYRYDW